MLKLLKYWMKTLFVYKEQTLTGVKSQINFFLFPIKAIQVNQLHANFKLNHAILTF